MKSRDSLLSRLVTELYRVLHPRRPPRRPATPRDVSRDAPRRPATPRDAPQRPATRLPFRDSTCYHTSHDVIISSLIVSLPFQDIRMKKRSVTQFSQTTPPKNTPHPLQIIFSAVSTVRKQKDFLNQHKQDNVLRCRRINSIPGNWLSRFRTNPSFFTKAWQQVPTNQSLP